MQFLKSVESPIFHKLDFLEKCDYQNFPKSKRRFLVAMQIALSGGSTFPLKKDCLKVCDPQNNF